MASGCVRCHGHSDVEVSVVGAGNLPLPPVRELSALLAVYLQKGGRSTLLESGASRERGDTPGTGYHEGDEQLVLPYGEETILKVRERFMEWIRYLVFISLERFELSVGIHSSVLLAK